MVEHIIEAGQGLTWVIRVACPLAVLGLGGYLGFLGWQKRAAVARFYTVVSGVTLWPQAHLLLAQHMAYARRYERPFVIAVFGLTQETGEKRPPEWSPALAHGHEAAGPRCRRPTMESALLVGALLRGVMRTSDIITYDLAHDRYVTLLPEATPAQAHHTVQRLSDLVAHRTHLRLQAGIAAFSADGVTLEALIEQACAGSAQHVNVDGSAAALGRPHSV